MTERQTSQGEHPVQSSHISSSSDLYNTPLISKFVIRGRPTIRRPRAPPKLEIHPSQLSSLLYERLSRPKEISTRYATISVIALFVSFLISMYVVYSTFPKVTEEEKQYIKIPWNIEDAKNLGIVLNRYKGDHYYHVMGGLFLFYIFLQTFAIPGSIFLSILSGYLFPFYVALILVCTCSMSGASLCFCLSQFLGRRLVLKYFPERASKWKLQVDKHRDDLFNYMVFLRVTPIVPNWFINISSPVIGVPLVPFALGTFIGVAPPSFFAIQGGQTLHQMTIEDTAFNLNAVIWLMVFGVISIIPILLKNRIFKTSN